MSDLISRQAAIDVLEERLQANGYSNVALISEFNRSIGYLMQLPSEQRNDLKYTGESICLYCQTDNCDGCMYEPLMGEQE